MKTGTNKETPHIKPQGNPIAETVLLPGDPLRAKHIADTYLDNVVTFNEVRGMLGFTGEYKGKQVSVMGTGMGTPSMALYSWELIHVFGVKNLIRVGSCGAIQENMELYDIVLAMGASTDSEYVKQFHLPGHFAPIASFKLLDQAKKEADNKDLTTHVGNVLSSDIFYNADETAITKWKDMGILCAEMETNGLYLNAAYAGVNALITLLLKESMYHYNDF